MRWIASLIGIVELREQQLVHATNDVPGPPVIIQTDGADLSDATHRYLIARANKTFMAQIELVARLIRSKGVGVFFVTHAPTDVPSEVLGQLGNRVQHALRAFTPDDLATVRATADTSPTSEFYDLSEELTRLGIGEAIVSALDPKGRPMPAARTMMRPPTSLMAQVDPAVFDAVSRRQPSRRPTRPTLIASLPGSCSRPG